MQGPVGMDVGSEPADPYGAGERERVRYITEILIEAAAVGRSLPGADALLYLVEAALLEAEELERRNTKPEAGN